VPAKTIKAAVVRKLREPSTTAAVSAPAPRHGEFLAGIAAARICHTELHAAEGDWPVKPSLPFVPGRGGVGVVAAVAVWVHMYSGDAGLM
jgi:alcohol dehydrogenase, propanol-preferring